MQGKLYAIMEICRSFDQIFKDHLDGVYVLHFCILVWNFSVSKLTPYCIHFWIQTNFNNLQCSYRRPGGDKIYNVFDNQLPAALKRLQFDKQLSMENIRKLITEADGYQPHLIAPEQGYRRLIESSLITIRGPAEAAVDAVWYSYSNYQNLTVDSHSSMEIYLYHKVLSRSLVLVMVVVESMWSNKILD